MTFVPVRRTGRPEKRSNFCAKKKESEQFAQHFDFFRSLSNANAAIFPIGFTELTLEI